MQNSPLRIGLAIVSAIVFFSMVIYLATHWTEANTSTKMTRYPDGCVERIKIYPNHTEEYITPKCKYVVANASYFPSYDLKLNWT
jgi:allantoicase